MKRQRIAKGEAKDAPIMITATLTMRTEYQTLCQKLGRSTSSMSRELIQKFIDEQNKKQEVV